MSKLIRLACLLAMTALPAFAQAPAPTPGRPAPAAVPGKPPPPPPTIASPAAVAAGGKVDVNGAGEAQLDTLPGVGPARAKAIIANRPYADLRELVSKKVLSQGVFDGAKPQLALANINTSGAADLARTLPGVGDARAKAIVAGRPYASPQDLVSKGVLTQGVFDKIKDIVAY